MFYLLSRDLNGGQCLRLKISQQFDVEYITKVIFHRRYQHQTVQ